MIMLEKPNFVQLIKKTLFKKPIHRKLSVVIENSKIVLSENNKKRIIGTTGNW